MNRINSRKELMSELGNKGINWVFFYAPLCGTCELARTFISMVEKVKEEEFVNEMDLNLCKDEAREWQIQSVPCLVKFSDDLIEEKLYAFESVSTVFEFINKKHKVKKGDE